MATEQKVKKKSIFRIEVIIPFLILGLLFFVYFKFFLDTHLKWALESALKNVNYAEANVQTVKTSFLDGEILISGVEVTDRNNPEFNLFALEGMHFKLSWDALLRAKILIENAEIKEILIKSKRKKAGKVFPKPEKKKSETVAAVEQEIGSYVAKEHQDNILSNVWSFLGNQNFDQELKNIGDSLESEKKLKKLEEDFNAKNSEWKKTLGNLKESNKGRDLYQKAKNFKLSKKPDEALKQLKEVRSMYKEAKAEYDTVSAQGKSLVKDVNLFKNQLKQVDDWIKADINSLKKRLKIPNLEVKNISVDLLINIVKKKIAPYMVYYRKVKPYLPKSTPEDEEELKAHERSVGKNFYFPVSTGYPLFWIKNMGLGVSQDKNTTQGMWVKGSLQNVSSDVNITKKPFELDMMADLFAYHLSGLKWQANLNPKNKPYEIHHHGTVNRIGLEEITLSKDDKAQVALGKSSVGLKFNGIIFEKGTELKANAVFSGVEWKLESEKKKVTQLMQEVIAPIQSFSANIMFKGNLKKPRLNINSDLGKKIEDGIKLKIQEKLKGVQDKIDRLVRDKLSTKKSQLLSKIGAENNSLMSQINRKNLDLKNINSSFRKLQDDYEKKYKKQLKGKAKDLLKDLKNKLPF